MTTIAQERAKLADVGRPLRLRSQWGSRFDYSGARSVTEPATRVFIHITITNPSSYGSDDAHARAVEAIGISRFPSTGVSYNRLHMQSGTAYEAQPIGRRGAHTVNDKQLSTCGTPGCPSRGGSFPGGNLNYSVRAYAICQNVGHAVTDAELHSLAKSIAADQLAGFVIKGAPIHGHRCVAYKECPAAQMWARMVELDRLVDHYVTTGFTTQEDEWDMATADEVLAKVNVVDQKVTALQNDINAYQQLEGDRWAQGINENRAQTERLLGVIAAQQEIIDAVAFNQNAEAGEDDVEEALEGQRWAQGIEENRQQADEAKAAAEASLAKLDELLALHPVTPPTGTELPKA